MTYAVMPETLGWAKFILEHGWRAHACELAAAVGQDVDEVERLRRTGACKPLRKAKRFSELFSLWHGRPPEENEWPCPRKFVARNTYEWQPPEVALLASLVGRLGVTDIAQTLTSRLRERTGDAGAERTKAAIQARISQIGMQSNDVIGGITTSDAGREIGSLAIINQVIRKKELPAHRVGRLWVIPHEAWKAWKAKRVSPPDGFVLLRSIRDELSIRSDKLSEFARMGYVPTAVRCNPYGTKAPSTKFGTWYIDQKVADQLLADRRAGRPMPWHGKPLQDNLGVTFKLWKARQHPPSCKTCADIWGERGPPHSFEEYVEAYPPLAHGAKRHLTHKWSPGMTIPAVAIYTGRSVNHVRHALQNGMLEATLTGGRRYISRTEATRWKARKCPSGDNAKSWISLATAKKHYLFTLPELHGFIARGRLNSKVGTNGPMRGVVYVSKHQCGKLREEIGFTEEVAARRIGVSVPKLRVLLEGVNWRKAKGIPLAAVQAAVKRLDSHKGYSIGAAATEVGESVQWVLDRKDDGTIKVSRARWDRRRIYISKPMLRRLREAKQRPVRLTRVRENWLRLSEAAHEAGVTNATIARWVAVGELDRQPSNVGWQYYRDAVRARARTYWSTVRFRRATPPTWLLAETEHGAVVPSAARVASSGSSTQAI